MRRSQARLPDGINECFDIVQQPRRFACDRCRLQKLRCERDIWRPTLMPCRRCRKANICCTISTSAPTSRKVKQKLAMATKQSEDDCSDPRNEHQEISSSSVTVSQDSRSSVDTPRKQIDQELDNVPALDHQGAVMDRQQGHLKTEPFNDEYYSVNDFDVEMSNMPLQEGQLAISNMAIQAEQWSIEKLQFNARSVGTRSGPLKLAIVLESFIADEHSELPYDSESVPSPNWEHMYCRSLLDLNIQFLDCERRLSQGFVMPGCSTTLVTSMECNLTSLDYAVQTVIACSERFMNAVRVSGSDDQFDASITGFTMSNPPEIQLPAGIFSISSSESRPGLLPQAGQLPSSCYRRPTRWADMDAPAVIAALSCYTCLIGMYHLVLSYILQEVTVPSPLETRFTPAFRHPLAHSERIQEPQLRMLFLTMTQMLGRVENSLGLPETGHGALQDDQGSRIASHPVAAGLLNTYCGNGVGDRQKMVEDMIQRLRQYINGV